VALVWLVAWTTSISRFLGERAARRGTPMRIVPTRANGQPAFGCYVDCPHTEVSRAYGLLVLTRTGSKIAEMTFFADSSVFPTSARRRLGRRFRLPPG
jgi:hypothetical protein